MNDELIQKYKRLADNNITDQQPEMWDRIEETLELEKGWDRINATLRRRERRPVILMCLTAGLLLLISALGYFRFGSTLYFKSEQYPVTAERQSTKIDTENNLQVSNNEQEHLGLQNEWKSKITSNDSSRAIKQLVTANRSEKSALKSNSSAQKKNTNESHIHSNSKLSSGKIMLEKVEGESQIENYIAFPLKVEMLKQDTAVSYVIGINELRIRNKQRYYILTSIGLRGTIFLNNHTSKAMQNQSYEYISIKPSSSFQLGLGSQVSDKYFIEGRLHLNNQYGQTTHYLSEGKSIYTDTRLKYTTIETSLGYYLYHSGMPRLKNFCSSIQSGFYVSYLQDVRVQTNSSAELNSAKFKSSDYGMIFRYDLHRRSGPFDICAGAFTTLGLRNISKSQQGVPAFFNRCYNTALGLNFSVKYFL